jgi:hypothetical protein
VDAVGRLVGIEERRGLTAASDLDPSAQVSMNLWGFGSSALGALAPVMDRFIAERSGSADAELAIPDAMSHLVRHERTVLVHEAGEHWIGVTYPGDLEWARDQLREVLAEGAYPAQLEGLR